MGIGRGRGAQAIKAAAATGRFKPSLARSAPVPKPLAAPALALLLLLPLAAAQGGTPPVAAFDVSPAAPSTDDVVRFTDRSTDADGRVVGWLWFFGDGTTSQTQNATHRYLAPGTYNVTLAVRDDSGAVANVAREVAVTQGLQPVPQPTLQDIIDEAAPGALVRIPPAQFNETVRIAKDLVLIGGRNATIDGGDQPAILITNASVRLDYVRADSRGAPLVAERAPFVQLWQFSGVWGAAPRFNDVGWLHVVVPAEAELPRLELRNTSWVHAHPVNFRIMRSDGTEWVGARVLVLEGERATSLLSTNDAGETPSVAIPHHWESADGRSGDNQTFVVVEGSDRRYPVDSHAPTMIITTSAAGAQPQGLFGNWRWFAVAALAILAALSTALDYHEGFRWRWMGVFSGMYARLAQTELAQSGLRETVYGFVESHPGASLRELAKGTKLKWGTLHRNLSQLLDEGAVRVEKDKRLLRWSPVRAPALTAGQEALQGRMLGVVRESPGGTPNILAATVKQKQALVDFHVARLVEQGRLRREEAEGETRLFPAESPGEAPPAAGPPSGEA